MKFTSQFKFMPVALAAAFSSFGFAAGAQAVVLADYQFATATSGTSASGDVDVNTLASVLAAGSGVNLVSSGTGNPPPWCHATGRRTAPPHHRSAKGRC